MKLVATYPFGLPLSWSVLHLPLLVISSFTALLQKLRIGIPEIEGAMDGYAPCSMVEVLPVKFFGGMGALRFRYGLGREGPTVQMGGSIGRMVTDIFQE